MIFSPENTLADFPVGSTLLNPKASRFAGNLRDQSWILSQGRRLPRALSDQRAHTGQAASDSLLLTPQEPWAVPHTDHIPLLCLCCSIAAQRWDTPQQAVQGDHTGLHCISVCCFEGRQDTQAQGVFPLPSSQPAHLKFWASKCQ